MRPLLDQEQLIGAEFLATRRVAMLADEPGVGKTAQIVRACEYVKARAITGFTKNRTLALNTAREFQKWGLWGWPITILEDGKADVPDEGLVLTTYALSIRPRIRKLLRARRVDVLFCDEAHWLKDMLAVSTTAILGSAGAATNAHRTWLATGTPVPNNASELFVLAKISGVWSGNYTSFVNEFCEIEEAQEAAARVMARVEGIAIEIARKRCRHVQGVKIIGSKNHAKLRELIAPVYLRRKARTEKPRISELLVEAKSDPYATLPELDRQRLLYAIETGDMSFADTPAMASVRRLVGLAKAPGVAELVAGDLEGGYEKVLVFCQHTDVIRLIAEKLSPFGVGIYDGKVPQRERERIYDAFGDEATPRVLVCQIQAAGEGLDKLKRANRVYLAEPSWTPKENDQAIARAARRGQTKPVHASYVMLEGSLDERITAALERKRLDITQIV